MCVTRPVGTRGGCGAGRGPCACPGGNAIQWGTSWSTKVAPQPGQAQGLLIHSTPPLVPTGPWAASTSMEMIPRFGRQHSSGLDLAAAEELSSAFEPCLTLHSGPFVLNGLQRRARFD